MSFDLFEVRARAIHAHMIKNSCVDKRMDHMCAKCSANAVLRIGSSSVVIGRTYAMMAAAQSKGPEREDST
jgi:hypothetical protein